MESRSQAFSGRNTNALFKNSDVLGAASDPGGLTGLPQEKRCIDCNVEVSHQARYKDSDGRYRCRSCEFARRSVDAVEVDPSPLVYAKSVPRRLVVSIVLALLAVIVSTVAYLYFDGRWERLHRDTILSLKAAADSDFAANRLPEAMHGYESVVQLAGQHQLESQTLQSEVEMSRQRIVGLQLPLQQIEEKRRLAQVRAEGLAQAEDSDRLGQAFEFGNGQTQDLHKAVEFYQKAANAGLASGMRDMGRMYDPRLNTVFEDGEKALWWYEKAVEGGDVVAAFLKARLQYDGTDVKRDRDGAERQFKSVVQPLKAAADKGDVTGMYAIGVMTLKGLGVPKDEVLGQELLVKAAKAGNTWADNELADLLYSQKDVIGVAPALSVARHAAGRGDVHGMFVAGFILGADDNDMRQAEGLKLIKRAAALGHPASLSWLAYLYSGGYRGADEDHARSMQLYQQAAQAGSRDAMSSLAQHYRIGFMLVTHTSNGQTDVGWDTSMVNQSLAAKWYEKAAERGDTASMVQLAKMYEDGSGVARNHEAALRWANRAVMTGEPSAPALVSELNRRPSR